MKRHSLLQRFSLLGLAAFLVAGLALGAILTSSLEKSVTDHSKNETARFVAAEVDMVFPGMDFSLPMTGPRYEDFQRRVPRLLFNPSIKRIKVWNLDSVIVWSDERQLVGKQFPNDKELLEALNGTISSKIASLDKQENQTERQYRRLLELYIPIRSEHEGKVKAVVEIYRDLEDLDAEIWRQKRILWISIFAGFSGIYFACFGIVWRASRRLTEQTLEVEKSEERNRDLARELTSLINNVPGIVYRGYRDWSLSFIGAGVEPVTGYPPDTFTSGAVGWKEIIHPDDMEQVKETFRNAAKEKADTLRVEYRIRNKDGGIRWISDRRQLIYEESGAFAKVDGLLLDITERKKREQELWESEDRYRDLVEHSHELICTHDLEGRLLSVNSWAAGVIGYSQDELLRMNMRDLLVPETRHEFGRYLDEIRTHGAAQGMLLIQTRNGERRIWEYNNTLRTEGVTEPVVRGMAHDITERKRAEKAGIRLGMAVDQAAEAVVITDPEGAILYVNPAFERITGYLQKEAVGQNMRILKSGKQDEMFYRNMWGTISRGEVWRGRFINKKKDGTLYEEEAVISPVRNASGKIINFVAVKQDITRMVSLEKQVRMAQKMDAVGTLAGGIAHDFNNALTVIIGFGEMLRLRIVNDPKTVSDLDQILGSAERASVLTRQLLTFARRQVVEPVHLDLNEVMTDLVILVRKVTREDIEIKTFPVECPVMIRADRGQVEQVLMNLCLNARDAMPEGGQLVIETGVTSLEEGYLKQYPYMMAGRYAVLSVSDTGIGMDEKTRERIFEPFFTTKGPDKGTGLGLAMVYGIVKQHNGFIHVYSEPGKGTTFRVYFPEVDAPADAKVIASQGVARGGNETILLAEDNESVRHLTEQTLVSFGYKVLIACDGEEAVDIFRRNGKEIAMAVLDVVMPKMGGKQAYDEITKISPGLKVLFLSGYSANAIHDSFVLHPGIPFLQKPFGPSTLARKVREVLDRK
jgi:PAS domain S-box-containing protein